MCHVNGTPWNIIRPNVMINEIPILNKYVKDLANNQIYLGI